MGKTKDTREKARLFENIDMEEVWRNYAKNVQEHLERNRQARVESRDPKRAKHYG